MPNNIPELSAAIANARNTSLTAFQSVVDGIIKDFKADNQELAMVVAMLPVLTLDIDTIAHLIKGDKMLYVPAARSNASKKKGSKNDKPSISAINQQRGALAEMLPHYVQLQTAAATRITAEQAEMARIKKAATGKLGSKALAALAQNATVKHNAAKSEAQLQCEAIEKMFSRAIAKLYYLRRISATDVKLDAKRKCIKYTAFHCVTSSGKAELSDSTDDYVSTLAELSRDSNAVLKADGVTAVRSNGKGANKRTDTGPDTAAAPIDAAATIAENSKALASMVRTAIKAKDKANITAVKKAEGSKALFTAMLEALFIADKALDLNGLQKAIDVAMAKAAVPRKVFVHYGSEMPAANEEKVA